MGEVGKRGYLEGKGILFNSISVKNILKGGNHFLLKKMLNV